MPYFIGWQTVFLVGLSFAGNAVANSVRFFDIHRWQFIAQRQLLEELEPCEHIVLGEFHYEPAIQMAQAKLIGDLVEKQERQGSFQIAWEFLNRQDRSKLAKLEPMLKAGSISGEQFLTELLGSYEGNTSYYPILEKLMTYECSFLATNLSRAEKRPVVENGLPALNPALLPPGFAEGGAAYFERFVEAFQGHTDPTRIDNYFAAQSLTDDVMAYSIVEDSQPNLLVFLITGNFHSDYHDGVVARLQIRAPERQTCTVRFMKQNMWDESIILHPKWGAISDYIVVVKD